MKHKHRITKLERQNVELMHRPLTMSRIINDDLDNLTPSQQRQINALARDIEALDNETQHQ